MHKDQRKSELAKEEKQEMWNCFFHSTGLVAFRRALCGPKNYDNPNQGRDRERDSGARDAYIENMKHSMIPVVLSGGSGTRLWPVSRAQWPKQFCQFFDDSLLNLTLQRLQHWEQPRVLTAESMRVLTETSARRMGLQNLKSLYEPEARNTAPAVAFLLRQLEIENAIEDLVGVFPADQLIRDSKAFEAAVETALHQAHKGKIVTLGVKPTSPNTGYGYIQTAAGPDGAALPVLKFHEKPDLQTAEKFLQDGHYFWNAGIFIFKGSSLREAFKKLQPQIWELASQIKPDLSNLKEIYARFPSISIDYAIMEKLTSEELSSVPVEMGWSDVGSWDAISEILEHDGRHKPTQINGKGNFVFSLNEKKNYSVVGADDLILVDTGDALMVVKKGASQSVKAVVDELTKNKSSLTKTHLFEERPWGKFEVLRDTDKFKSKVIEVQPGQQLSLQSHAKREEHWVVVQGQGEVVLNDKTIPMQAGSYIHIPLGAKHRMRNTGKEPVVFVEVQTGSYFGEDDIVRYQDDYKRK